VSATINETGVKPLSEEKLEFTRKLNILGNLGLFAWVFLAFFSVVLYNIIYGWLYLIVEAGIIYGILRRIGCSSCHKCRVCTLGFGRLAGAFFGRGFVKKESVGKRIGLIAFVYFLLLLLPATLLVLSIPHAFSFQRLLYCFAFWQ